MIQGIFYARFLPQEGTKIVAQSPPGCIVPVDGVDRPCLFDFGVLQEYIIPRKAFYNRYMTVLDPEGKYAVLGFPVSIPNPKYDRNEFIFNFGLVVEADADQVPYERVVRRLAITFAEMEKQSGYLSRDSSGLGTLVPGGIGGTEQDGDDERRGRRPIESLLEIVKEDLNNYGECMIPVDDANAINMKLFPYHPNPPQVKGWHVPVAKMKFAEVVDPTWDLTLQRVIAHIDGVSDVRRIAFEADVSLELAQLALRHLLYYDTILLLDMFFFGACYAPRPHGMHDFVANVDGIVDECAAYVCVGSVVAPPPGSSSSLGERRGPGAAAGEGVAVGANGGGRVGGAGEGGEGRGSGGGGAGGQRVSSYWLIRLMTSFCVGKSVAEWLKGHMDAGFDVLRYVDVRRLVQFGVIKGCLYRVHKYVVSKQYLASLATGQSRPKAVAAGGDPLQSYTDGCHSFDQIITEQNMTDAEIMEKLKHLQVPPRDLSVLYR